MFNSPGSLVVLTFAAMAVCAAESDASKQRPNRLINEKSPYLQQHAYNPVDWYPWGEEAFAKARRENKPIFLSIGYSTCHWCHVMERESFQDPETAALMNKSYVNIKVDREERPDVDRVYMTFVQAATGGGGWPMSVWLTPDLKPFVGGTYFPPEDRFGRPGFRSALKQIAELWEKDREKITASSAAILNELRRATEASIVLDNPVDLPLANEALDEIRSRFDPQFGGFSKAPKFPHPVTINFLLRVHARTAQKEALEMSSFTLLKMAEGGIYDHLGGGFHRYSVDGRWHVPHFEKMLYDQAQLVSVYLDAYQITGDKFFAEAAADILAYVRRDLTGPEGQFYSAEDADSPLPEDPKQQGEGAFYVWEEKEIASLLPKETAEIFSYYYGVEKGGNVPEDPHGEFKNKNILIVTHTLGATAKKHGKTEPEARALLAEARRKLLEARSRRPRPYRDDKTLTAWNGLMISAFARAHQVLRDPVYLEAAQKGVEFVRHRLYNAETKQLWRRFRLGEAGIPAYADDYAFLIQALLDLYETEFKIEHLVWAQELQMRQDHLFFDSAHGGYYSTSGGDPSILLRMKDDYDGAEPSANSVATLNLLRLAEMLNQPAWRERAQNTFKAFSQRLTASASAMPQLLAAFEFYRSKPKQVVLAGKPGTQELDAMIRVLHERFVPNKIVLLADGAAGQKKLAEHVDFIKDVRMIENKPTAYVCQDYVCQLPTNDLAQFRKLLHERGAPVK